MYASSRRSSRPLPNDDDGAAFDAGDQTLRSRFLVAGRAVDLAGEKQARDALGFEPASRAPSAG